MVMAVTARLYGKMFLAAFNKEIDWLDDVIKTTLHASGYTPDQDVHDFQDDLTNELATAGGYTAGGVTLAGKTLTYTAGTNIIMADANDAVWATASFTTARTAVVADTQSGAAATNPLICYQQESADVPAGGGEFRVAWHADGIFRITVS